MDKEILEILKTLQKDNQEIKLELKEINRKLDGVVEQTADLLEFRSDITKKVDGIRDDLSTVELVTAKNYKDIVNLKAVK
ncbi:plasmid stabilization protein [Clostridium gasigenes]|uniref:plasmid stabilization protein n=1 Tax=Clostridium gasigenes TaxID=94869 RepID=UPI0016239008|nr:plasmid stabilization protein [Clostridium gasigenes]MBB6625573.1 plasmid stabilization protein [Clostridium gasigenes]